MQGHYSNTGQSQHVVFVCELYLMRGNWRVMTQLRDGIFKLLRIPGIDSKESIWPAYVAWRAGTTTLFLLDS